MEVRRTPERSIPPTVTEPVWESVPAIARNSVDLPAPLGPITDTHSPGDAEMETLDNNVAPLMVTLTPVASTLLICSLSEGSG